MADRPDVAVRRVVDERGRSDVVAILGATYLAEKHWVSDPEAQFPRGDIFSDGVAWFVASGSHGPAGVVRIPIERAMSLLAERAGSPAKGQGTPGAAPGGQP